MKCLMSAYRPHHSTEIAVINIFSDIMHYYRFSPFSNKVGLPLHNIPSPFLSVMDIFFVDLKF